MITHRIYRVPFPGGISIDTPDADVAGIPGYAGEVLTLAQHGVVGLRLVAVDDQAVGDLPPGVTLVRELEHVGEWLAGDVAAVKSAVNGWGLGDDWTPAGNMMYGVR